MSYAVVYMRIEFIILNFSHLLCLTIWLYLLNLDTRHVPSEAFKAILINILKESAFFMIFFNPFRLEPNYSAHFF